GGWRPGHGARPRYPVLRRAFGRTGSDQLAPARRSDSGTARQPRRHHGGRHARAGQHLHHRGQRRVPGRRDPDHDRLWSTETTPRREPEPDGPDIPAAWRRHDGRYHVMSVRANPTIIGGFVLGASILIVAGLLLWGGTGMFRPKYRVVMYFDSAVTGLQKGAPVMLRGVRVGEVTDVNMRWGNWLATVYANFEPDSLQGVRPRDLDDALTRTVQERNLRAQLRMQSFVTGVLYVALDDFPGTPIVLHGLDKDVREVPTVPTDIEKWTAKVEKIADALASLPLDELARSLIATVDEAKRILKSPEIASSLKSLD